MFAALLDTCVLWPSRQRDFLLSLAVENLYRPLWSSAILDELRACEIDKHMLKHGLSEPDAESKAAYLIEQMRTYFDDAEVRNWEPYEGTFGLPDPYDEHVLAAAVAGHAVPHGIEILMPCEFAANTVAVSPQRALKAVMKLTQRYKTPPVSVDDFLKVLRDTHGLDEAVDLIDEFR
ncbi:PIN domain-containing protein [Kribbella jiaozuonensis]|uniref:PIN domain-containing protein n=1 Tax=Kribbella jiaozuonensis TaxID=2575441 RepID=A0A4U3M250_9ACTN|nr:PIN domain-containing protein [Kribbella jiaozuonensis]TKK82099.1 PIN domain-containing protein [Kribbella jiaozuonensis]